MVNTTAKGHSEVAEARSEVYNLFSALYLELPSLPLLENVFSAEFERQLSTAAIKLDLTEMKRGLKLVTRFVADFKDQPKKEVLTRVSVDRTRLLRGVNPQLSPPPPYESVYREGRLWGKSTVDVAHTFPKLGAKPPEQWTEPPDYIGIEFDLMRIICHSELNAWQSSDAAKALGYLEAGRDFLKRHILQWVPGFCEQMYQRAELTFYQGIARMTDGFVKYDSHLVDYQINGVKNILAEQA